MEVGWWEGWSVSWRYSYAHLCSCLPPWNAWQIRLQLFIEVPRRREDVFLTTWLDCNCRGIWMNKWTSEWMNEWMTDWLTDWLILANCRQPLHLHFHCPLPSTSASAPLFGQFIYEFLHNYFYDSLARPLIISVSIAIYVPSVSCYFVLAIINIYAKFICICCCISTVFGSSFPLICIFLFLFEIYFLLLN